MPGISAGKIDLLTFVPHIFPKILSFRQLGLSKTKARFFFSLSLYEMTPTAEGLEPSSL